MSNTRILALALVALGACRTFQTIPTGHRALRFDPSGGLRRDIISEGRWELGRGCSLHACSKLIDFDVTYSTSHEEIKTNSLEGLAMELRLSIQYKPIVAELYELATEVSTNDYYNEVINPEFRSAASGVFARHSYAELATNKEKIENEIEGDVQRRIKGMHLAISSITIESINYTQEIQNATRARIVGEQEALRQKAAAANEAERQKTAIENDDLKKSLALEQETKRAQFEIQSRAAEQQLKLTTELAEKKNERAIAEEDTILAKAQATATIAKARAEAEAITILARAHAEENRAATQSISPLTVQMKAYEALGQLGGKDTTIMLGDFSHLPTFLFPPGFAQNMFQSLAPRTK